MLPVQSIRIPLSLHSVTRSTLVVITAGINVTVAKLGFPHSRLYAFSSNLDSDCLPSFLDSRHARFPALEPDCCNFPCPPTHEYSYSPLVAGTFGQSE